MPAAIRSKTTALADITNDAGKNLPLAGMTFAFSGKFSASQVSLKGIVERFGGSCAGSVTKKVTHIVTTSASLALEERPTALATAMGRGLPMLSEAFLHSLADGADGGRAVSPSKHLLHAGGIDAEKTKQLASAKEIVEQELQGARCFPSNLPPPSFHVCPLHRVGSSYLAPASKSTCADRKMQMGWRDRWQRLHTDNSV